MTTTDPTTSSAPAPTGAASTDPGAPPASAPAVSPAPPDPVADLRAQLADAQARLAVFTQRHEVESLLRAARARNVPELTDAAVDLLRTSPGISLPTAVRAVAARHAHLFPPATAPSPISAPASGPGSSGRLLGLDAPTLRAAARGDLRALLAMFSARRRSAGER